MGRGLVLLVAALGALASAAAPARACTRAEPVFFQPDPSLRDQDSQAPTPFTQIVARVDRHPATICRDGECTTSTCGSFGSIALDFVLPRDDQNDARTLGYRVVWLRGSRPKSAGDLLEHNWPLSDAARGESDNAELSLELSYEEVANLDADIALVAIDPAGNESEMSEPIHLEWSGCTRDGDQCLEAAGCSVSRPAANGRASWFGFTTLALGLIWRRSRRGRARR
ncbi:MAG TPA: hypothetical protein VJV78_23005 [Polyangiales bacterium]|nr:hypothetical protein [Polyangiales bacterium]